MKRNQKYRIIALLLVVFLFGNLVAPTFGHYSRADGNEIITEESLQEKETETKEIEATETTESKKDVSNPETENQRKDSETEINKEENLRGNKDEKFCFVLTLKEKEITNLNGKELIIKDNRNTVIQKLKYEDGFCIEKEKINSHDQIKAEVKDIDGYFDSFYWIKKENYQSEIPLELVAKVQDAPTIEFETKVKEKNTDPGKIINGIPVRVIMKYQSKGYYIQDLVTKDGKIQVQLPEGGIKNIYKDKDGIYRSVEIFANDAHDGNIYDIYSNENKEKILFYFDDDGKLRDQRNGREYGFYLKVRKENKQNHIYVDGRVKSRSEGGVEVAGIIAFSKSSVEPPLQNQKVTNKIIIKTEKNKKPDRPRLFIKGSEEKVTGDWIWNDNEEQYEFIDERGEYDRNEYRYEYFLTAPVAPKVKNLTIQAEMSTQTDYVDVPTIFWEKTINMEEDAILSGELSWENREEKGEEIKGEVTFNVRGKYIEGERVNRIILKGFPEGYTKKLGKIIATKGTQLVSEKLEWKWDEEQLHYYMDHHLRGEDEVYDRTKFVYRFDPLLNSDILKEWGKIHDEGTITIEMESFVQNEENHRIPQWDDGGSLTSKVEVSNKSEIQEDLRWEENKIQGNLVFMKDETKNRIKATNILRLEGPEGYELNLPTLTITRLNDKGEFIEEKVELSGDAKWEWDGEAYTLVDERDEEGFVIYKYHFDEDFNGKGEEIDNGHHQIEIHGIMLLKFVDETMEGKSVSSRLVPKDLEKVLVRKIHNLPQTGISPNRYGIQYLISMIGVVLLYFTEKKVRWIRGGK